MKKLLVIALTASAALAGIASTAEARQGCGIGFHRDMRGYCHPNRRPGAVIVVPGARVGVFYHGRGWWDGHRYWAHREWHHGGWRYR
ncbi:MAG: hypothetical protein J0H18_19385 [Rhizobiales bacterium]|nr:hypothetical protein [Hyphomicrobiales bacterium]OJY03700.1 MAG: hypothetical protein BGP07_07380 [Rhizobiales bacterium 63-22]